MKLSTVREKKNITLRELAIKYGVSIDKIFRWSRDGADVKRIDGKSCIVKENILAVEVDKE